MSKFKAGETVALKVDPNRQGAVITVLPPVAGKARYQVFHGQGDIREYHEDQLQPVIAQSATDTLLDAVQSRQFLGRDQFYARMTATRLQHALVDTLYALHAARIQYIPFQFKPLLRLLRAERPRLLIADEVGVGKTIEAGLIYKELQTREGLSNVLIVCPKPLTRKWQAEMRRFDEDFLIHDANSLLYCIRETDHDGEWPQQYARSIVNLELLRQDAYTHGKKRNRGLFELDSALQFDLLIVDEAHHARNTDTNTHEVISYLCDASRAVIFLSATPLQTGSHNLFSLLRMLREDLFPDFSTFEAMVEPNQKLNEAMRLLRSRTNNWQRDTAFALRHAGQTGYGRRVLHADPLYQHWLNRLSDKMPLEDSERIRCLRDVEELHTLAHIMNRTRRRDIGSYFTVRDPKTVAIDFTEAQRQFYEQMVAFRYDYLAEMHGSQVARLIADMLERQAASCLPAMRQSLDRLIATGDVDSFSDLPVEETQSLHLTPALRQQYSQLQQSATELPPDDPKLDELMRLVDETLHADGPRKVLVFSFFLHTLHYLHDHMLKRGYRVALVTGAVTDDEREWLRERFAKPHTDADAVDVLLSSEVGCEGLDYQFCDRLVNYDIPWNPMRIEQRIGRIDRYGQQSEKVLIYNFITPGTVEERIYYRCFERLGVFTSMVGDLEGVLGDMLSQLDAINDARELSPQQLEERVRQIADNSLRYAVEQDHIEDSGIDVMYVDALAGSDVERVIDEGRYFTQEDLYHLLDTYLAREDINARIVRDGNLNNCYRIRASKEARGRILQDVGKVSKQDRTIRQLQRWLTDKDDHFVMTFDQKTAVERREVAFITPVHPLIRVARDMLPTDETPLATCLHLEHETLQGRYVFIFELWEQLAIQSDVRVVAFLWDIDGNTAAPEAVHQVFWRALRKQRLQTATATSITTDLSSAFDNIQEYMHEQYTLAKSELNQRNEILVQRRLASTEAYYQNRLRRLDDELSGDLNERIRRMRQSQRDRVERNHEEQIQKINERREADIVAQRIAAGILLVGDT